MQCEQARQLFDAYLDGELSTQLATELGAHRLTCADCRQALALLEVSGHIIASDRDPVSLRSGFSERLLACMEQPRQRLTRRLTRGLYVGGPLAAAAVVVLAFLGVFDRGEVEVAGKKAVRVERVDGVTARPLRESPDRDRLGAEYPNGDADDRVDLWLEQTQRNLAAKRESGESLQKALDLTVLQLLDILKQARDASLEKGHIPATDGVAAPDRAKSPSTGSEDIEDL